MSTPPYIPSGPLPTFLKLADDEQRVGELRVAYASRVLVVASRDDELPETSDPARAPRLEDVPASSSGAELLPGSDVEGSASPRDAATNTRDAYATRNSDAAPHP